jgi:hypothetical protein
MGGIVDTVLVTGIQRTSVVLPPIVGQPPSRQNFITPVATIQTCGYNLRAEGKELQQPSFDMLLETINQCRMEEQHELGY